MNAFLRNRRAVCLAAAVVCFALVGYALYAQAYQGFQPCPLCIFQRIGLTALGATLLLATLLPARPLALRRVAAVLVAVAALATAGVAVRHLYIQHLPDGLVPVCGASLEYLREVFPLTEVLRKVLTGSGECHKVDWTFLGLAMPAWVLLWAVALGLAGFIASWRRPLA
jgi:disulfide bond formation protein DsbB